MRHSKTSLFLMELIIAILFFSLSGTVCIQLFAKAHIISRNTVDQNNAITQAQNLAEGWLSLEGDLQKVQPLFQDSILSSNGDRLYLLFDENWESQSGAVSQWPAYIAQLKDNGEAENGLIHANIEIFRASEASGAEEYFSPDTGITDELELIYALELSHHIPERRAQH